MTEVTPEVTRRQLMRRIAASSIGAGAVALAGPGAMAPAAAADATLIQVDLREVDRVGDAIQAAMGGDNRASDLIVHVCGAGTYPLYRRLRWLDKTNVHVVIDDDITFVIPGRPAQNLLFFYNSTRCSITGGTFDAANELYQPERIDGGNTGTFVEVDLSNGVTVRDVTFTNTDGWIGAGGIAPPAGLRAYATSNLHISGCSFELVQFCISLRDVSNVTVENCLVADLLDNKGTSEDNDDVPFGGALYLGREGNRNVTISGNRTAPGRQTYRDGEIGGSVIQFAPSGLRIAPSAVQPPLETTIHRNVTVSDNYFVSPPGPYLNNTGVAGDVIALKSVHDFSITRNVIENGGEFGIVLSHGSNSGVISENIVSGVDGGGIIIGAENDIVQDNREVFYQSSPRVSQVQVIDNLVVNPGIDANGLRRRQARPERTTTGNYPNAIAGMRVWNASDIALERNVVNQYRSSGIWVKHAFSRNIDDRLAEHGVTEKDINEVTGLTIAANNALIPWSDGAVSVTYNDLNWDDPELDAAAAEPWSGNSFRTNEDGTKASSAVIGIEASRIVSADPFEPVDHCVVLPAVVVTVRCLGGSGRIDTRIENSGAEDADYSVVVSGLSPRLVTIPAGETAFVVVTGRPPGTYIVSVSRDGEFVAETEVDVDCG